jgi:hypothetical protein
VPALLSRWRRCCSYGSSQQPFGSRRLNTTLAKVAAVNATSYLEVLPTLTVECDIPNFHLNDRPSPGMVNVRRLVIFLVSWRLNVGCDNNHLPLNPLAGMNSLVATSEPP